MTAVLFILFFFLAAINVPISFALGAASLGALLYVGTYPLDLIPMSMAAGPDSFPFLAIPFFILAGGLMEKAGISQRLIDLASSIVGPLPGGLAMVTVLASAFFGALSGSAPATLAAIGGIMIPQMVKAGYDAAFAGAVAAASGCLGLFIPPSITMITYGVASGTSIGDLFIAGVGPGTITALGLMTASYFICKKHGWGSTNEQFSFTRFLVALKNSFWAMLMPVIILGGIYGGIFTPTEAAAVAVFYALFVGLVITRELKMPHLWDILYESTKTTAMIMLIISTAVLFGRLLTLAQLPIKLVDFVVTNNLSPFLFLLVINIAMLIIGTFMDNNSAILILAPILCPVARTLGIDLVHLGAIMVVNMTFGLLTPPLGVHLFIASSLAKVTFEDVTIKILPLLAVCIGVILLVTYIPEVSLFLVNLLK